MHQKTMVVDELWGTVGTTNFDTRSFSHNEENNVCVYDPSWARALHEIFLKDLDGCDPIVLERWKQRGVRRRAMEVVASFLEEQA
jgi:cardiolipin synthase